MKREFLRKTVEGITDEQIDSILNAFGTEKEDLENGYNEKLKVLTTERDGLKEQIESRNKDLEELKTKVAGQTDLEAKLAQSEERYKKDTDSLREAIKQQEIDFKREAFFSGYKFSSKAAEAGVKAEFDKKGFVLEDGKFLGGKEFMDSLMENEDYKAAFITDSVQTDEGNGLKKNPPKFTTGQTNQTTEHKKMSLAELMQKKNENPNLTVSYD